VRFLEFKAGKKGKMAQVLAKPATLILAESQSPVVKKLHNKGQKDSRCGQNGNKSLNRRSRCFQIEQGERLVPRLVRQRLVPLDHLPGHPHLLHRAPLHHTALGASRPPR